MEDPLVEYGLNDLYITRAPWQRRLDQHLLTLQLCRYSLSTLCHLFSCLRILCLIIERRNRKGTWMVLFWRCRGLDIEELFVTNSVLGYYFQDNFKPPSTHFLHLTTFSKEAFELLTCITEMRISRVSKANHRRKRCFPNTIRFLIYFFPFCNWNTSRERGRHK